MSRKLKVSAGGGKTECLDILKFALSLFVVIRHSAQYFFPTGTDCIVYHVVVSGMSTVAVPTFFCITGYLLYESKWKKVKKQIRRIFQLYLIWSCIYLPMNFYGWKGNNQSLFLNFVEYLQNAIFSGTYFHLWYLPAAIVALIITYYLKERKFGIYVCLILLSIGMLTGPYIGMIDKFETIHTVVMTYQRLFVTTRNGIFIGTPFMFLGMMIKKNDKYIYRMSDWHLIMLLMLSVFVNAIEAIKLYTNYGNTINDILIFDAILAPCLVVIMLKYSCGKKSYGVFRKLSTAIYCSHPICLTTVSIICRKCVLNESATEYIGCCLVSSVALGLLIVAGSKKIKIINYLL